MCLTGSINIYSIGVRGAIFNCSNHTLTKHLYITGIHCQFANSHPVIDYQRIFGSTGFYLIILRSIQIDGCLLCVNDQFFGLRSYDSKFFRRI